MNRCKLECLPWKLQSFPWQCFRRQSYRPEMHLMKRRKWQTQQSWTFWKKLNRFSAAVGAFILSKLCQRIPQKIDCDAYFKKLYKYFRYTKTRIFFQNNWTYFSLFEAFYAGTKRELVKIKSSIKLHRE